MRSENQRSRRNPNADGYVFESNGAWFVRKYTGKSTVNKKGRRVYESETIRLGSKSAKQGDYVANKTAARTKAREMDPVKVAAELDSSKIVASDVTVEKYVADIILGWWERKLAKGDLKPSTVYGYDKIWRLYLQPRLGTALMRDYTTVKAGRLLDSFAVDGLNAHTVGHIRNVASEIFRHAATSGVIPVNPFVEATMLESATKPAETHKYTLKQIRDFLLALLGDTKAQTVVGLSFFGGLRPGEIRATRWENYVDGFLLIEKSVWRKHETTPKTDDSIKRIPVRWPLSEMLDKFRVESGNPANGYILTGDKGGPLNLDHYARAVLKPLLELSGLSWHGYYAGRRGLATLATEQVKDPTAAAGILRHKNITTTALHYVGIREASAIRGADAVQDLYKQLSASTEISEGV